MSQSKIIAHRGAWKKQGLPQNSLAALEHAKRLHCGGSELDVHLTADGVVVVNHDADFYGLPIEQSTYSDLCYIKHPNGENIPRLESYLSLAKELEIMLFLEIKSSIISLERSLALTETVLKAVQQNQADEFIHYISFEENVMRKVLSLHPAATASYLKGDVSPAQISTNQWQGIDYHFKIYQEHPQWILQARELGLLTNAWTVNDADTAGFLMEANINFITTDEPELLLDTIH